MFPGINNNAETSIAVSEEWVECMRWGFLAGEARKWKLGDTKSITSNQKRCNSPGYGELWELTSFIQSSNLTQSSQYVTVLKKGWREMVLEREQGSYRIPFRLTFLSIRIRRAVFVNRKILHMSKTLYATGFLACSCNLMWECGPAFMHDVSSLKGSASNSLLSSD